ncbi:MAG: MarR family transcriptional regulator [Prevotellaceae bacterium]|jgi:hypothetical protein|nr:MarR family transcriptional regulator [Prevotellaceae bacterium]
MKDLCFYLNSVLGIEITVIPLQKQLFERLPLYITATYKVQETIILGQRICLLIANDGENQLSPDRLAKQILFVTQKTGLPVVYVFAQVASYNIKRLIHKRINFIIPGKQMFIPVLMMDLCKTPDKQMQKAVSLTPFAQFLLLYHLQKDLLTGFTTQQLTDRFKHPYRTVSRAIKNLQELDLCALVGGKEKQLQFAAKGKKLWIEAQNVFQYPVERILFTDSSLNLQQTCASNMNALSYYTMLNDEEKRYYAVYKQKIKNITVETNKYAGDNVIEIWHYNPMPLSDNGFIDKLSLYLIFRNNTDERIQGELEKLINDIKWLEE